MAPAAAPTGVQRFDLRTNGESRVLFTSDAPLETVDGISTSTAGRFTVDLPNLSPTDYGIGVPALLRLKVSNDTRVRVDLTAFRHAM